MSPYAMKLFPFLAWRHRVNRVTLRADALASASPSETGEEGEAGEEPAQERGKEWEEPSPTTGNGTARRKESSTKTDDLEPLLPRIPPLPTPGEEERQAELDLIEMVEWSG